MWTPRSRRRKRALAHPSVTLLALALLACACSGGDEAAAEEEATTSSAASAVTTSVAPTTAPATTVVTTTTLTPTTTTTPPPPPTTLPPPPPTAAVPHPTAPPPPARGTLAAGVPTFRIPMNGRVNVSLAWDCGGCVAELGAKHHPAIDYVSRDDTTVVASGDGTVIFVNDGCGSPSQGCGQSMGNSIFLRHVLADGSAIHTFYAHLREIDPAVVMGACLRAGQRVGEMGNSGIGSAAHLHFAFQTTPEILQYTVESSYEYGSRNPDDYYGVVEVRPCA